MTLPRESLRYHNLSRAAVCKTTYMYTPETRGDWLNQSSADNVDHNLFIIDERGTFHGMKITESITPGIELNDIVRRMKEQIRRLYM